jgi:type I restriction enzyme M protein
MAIKKSDLYQRIWASCDALRGGMDASQYKDYVLTMLFIKYVSDKAKGDKFPEIKVPKGASFDDMLEFRNKSDIGDLINKKVIGKIDKENDLGGILTKVDFNNPELLGTGKEMVDRLTDLINIFHSDDLDFSKNKADGDDVLGDAYEYLMKHFATQSGKSKGQFYTPSEVSRILAKVIGVTPKNVKSNTTVYDPTCGSGSLLLKVAAETNNKVTLYGQEKDVSTAGLAKMNMVLHQNAVGLKNIMYGNTLSDPKHKTNGELTQFDYVVANPPFSDKVWSTGLTPSSDEHGRFQDFGCPPDKNGDYAYLLHILRSLKSKGKGAVILPHGVLFRGNAEEEIRKNLVKRGYIKAIIGLPANLFFGTGIPACIIVLDKEDADKREGIFMIDAGKGFVKDGNKNKLQEKDIHKIVDAYQKQENIPGFSRFVENKEIKENEHNLNIPRFIESTDEEIKQDIEAHLLGGIPVSDVNKFEDFWKECPGIKKELFKKSAREGYYDLKIDKNQIRQTIFEDSEFKEFSAKSHASFEKWIEQSKKKLEKFKEGEHPKELIFETSEELLEAFSEEGLINKYNVYQSLMTYWEEKMQDDVYAISADSWKVAQEFKRLKTDKGKEKKGIEGLEGILIPPMLLAKVKLTDLVRPVDEKTEELEKLNQGMLEVISENSGDEAIFDDVDEGKVPGAKYFKSKLDEVKLIVFSTLFKDKSNKLETIKNKKQVLLDEITELDSRDANGDGYLDDKVRNKKGILSISNVAKLVKAQHGVTGKAQLDDSWVSNKKDKIFYSIITKNNEIKDLDKQFKSLVSEMNETFCEYE